jgi:hypothetical protein
MDEVFSSLGEANERIGIADAMPTVIPSSLQGGI